MTEHTGGYRWGWSALAVDTAPKGWVCPCCRKRARKTTGRHFYPFAVACTPCARAAFAAWCDEGITL